MVNENQQSHEVLTSSKVRRLVPIAIFIALTAVTLQTPLLELTEQKLWSHMIIEHAAFFSIGALSVMSSERVLQLLYLRHRQELLALKIDSEQSPSPRYSTKFTLWWGDLIRRIFALDRTGLLWLSVAIILMGLWHLPRVFDTAAVDPSIHIIQHFSFIVVGVAGYLSIRGESHRIFLLIALIGMMGFAGLLFAVLDDPVYTVYSVPEHNEAGGYMVLTSTAILIIGLPAYLIKRTLSYVHARGLDS